MKVKVDVEQLRKGMYVSELDRPWLGSPFLFQGFQIASDEDLAKLREVCRYVYVDKQRSDSSDEIRQAFARLSDSPVVVKGVTRLQKEMKPDSSSEEHGKNFVRQVSDAMNTRDQTKAKVKEIMNQVRLGHSVDTKEARVLVNDLVGRISVNANAILWLTNLKNAHEYTAEHCLNVSILSIAFGRHLGLPREELELIGLGALLHDVGKMRTPQEILDKPGILTRDEFEIMKRHAEEGYQLINDTHQVPSISLEIIRHHHERVDGSGYPFGLQGEEILLPFKITSVADVYDAISSDRVYHRALPPQDALNGMYRRATADFGEELMREFIKCVGIYPVGSTVKLNNGAIGIVVGSNPEARLLPIILVVRDPQGKPVRPRSIINLATLSDARGPKAFSIAQVVNPHEYGINVPAISAEEAESWKNNG